MQARPSRATIFPEKLISPPLHTCALQRGAPVPVSNAAMPPITPTSTAPLSTAGKPGHPFCPENGVNQSRFIEIVGACPSRRLPQLEAASRNRKAACEHIALLPRSEPPKRNRIVYLGRRQRRAWRPNSGRPPH